MHSRRRATPLAKFEIELIPDGIADLLKSPGVLADLGDRAARVSSRHPGFKYEVGVGANRAAARVWTATPEARRAEAEHRALTRAFDAARG